MGQPYLDGQKLFHWLSAHSPVAQGSVSVVIDEGSSTRQVERDYYVLLEIDRPDEPLELTLKEMMCVALLFPPGARHFSAPDLARLVDDEELDEEFVKLVEEQLKQFRVQLGWHVTSHAELNVSKVRGQADLAGVVCQLRVQAAHKTAGVGYNGNPYVSYTDDPVRLGDFLDESALAEAWRECWCGAVRFREFT